ncbi:hypothetical protein ACFV2H_52345, partial [Streptomyces sp. NPDC059629]|uniref:hypothetical protein n=1 Tax=Streptomyces sp. NPDC059629 TaxID=3346889 RepID=UPI00369FD120
MLLRPGVTCEKAIRFLDDLVQGGLNDVRNSVPFFAQPMVAGVEPSKLAGPELVVTLRQYAEWTATTARELIPFQEHSAGALQFPRCSNRVLDACLLKNGP